MCMLIVLPLGLTITGLEHALHRHVQQSRVEAAAERSWAYNPAAASLPHGWPEINAVSIMTKQWRKAGCCGCVRPGLVPWANSPILGRC